MYGIIASNLTMIGYMGIKEGPTQAAFLAPILYVIYRAWNYTESCYKDFSMYFAYSNAVEIDTKHTVESTDVLVTTFSPDYYKQPWFYAPQVVALQPYRVDGEPLFTRKGSLAEVYYKEIPFSEQNAKPEELVYTAPISGYTPPAFGSSQNPLQSVDSSRDSKL